MSVRSNEDMAERFNGDNPTIPTEKVTQTPEGLETTFHQLKIPPPTNLGEYLTRETRRKTKNTSAYIRTIPLVWAQHASQLPGKSLNVALVLWYLSGLKRSTTVTLTRTQLQRFGIHPDAGRRGLRSLETAGLVQVQRAGKHSPRVILLNPPPNTEKLT